MARKDIVKVVDYTSNTREAALIVLATIVPKFAKKVAPIYKMLDWKWHGKDHTPTEQEIEELAIKLICQVAGSKSDGIGTGGIGVEVIGPDEDEEPYYHANITMNVSSHSFEKRFNKEDDDGN